MSIVNIEALTATYLRENDVRARTTPPDESHRDDSWVEITLINAPSDELIPVDYLVGFLVQYSCYAGGSGGQPEARSLGDSVRDTLALMPKVTFDDAVVSSVKFLTVGRIPDTSMEPARERYILDVRIVAHPKLGGS